MLECEASREAAEATQTAQSCTVCKCQLDFLPFFTSYYLGSLAHFIIYISVFSASL